MLFYASSREEGEKTKSRSRDVHERKTAPQEAYYLMPISDDWMNLRNVQIPDKY